MRRLSPARHEGIERMYTSIKLVHIATALLTVSGFVLRGFWMLTGNDLLEKKLVRVLPHVIDTFFLLSGVALLSYLDGAPLTQPWMLFKIAGLVAYIVLGTLAIRRGKTQAARAAAFFAALAVFAYTYGVAASKSPASWLAILAS